MLQGNFQKKVLGLLLFAMVIYVLSRLIHQNGTHQLYFLNQQVFYNGGKQQLVEAKHTDQQQQNLPTTEVKHSDETKKSPSEEVSSAKVVYKQKPNSPSIVPETDQNLIHVSKDDIAAKSADTLSLSQAGEMRQSDKTQPPVGVSNTNNQQQPITLSVVPEIDQRLLGMAKNGSFGKYVDSLSSSQLKNLTMQIVGVNNLTSDGAQKQFLKCTGDFTLKNLYGKHPKSPIEFPRYQHCKKMSFKSSGPLVTLSSVPGSGNSWVRQLVESATGIHTGAVYCDLSYVKVGMIGEGMYTNNVLLVKIHLWPSYIRKYINNDKAIYVVRSPFNAILAENNRNIARVSKKYLALGDSHIMEVDFNYTNNSDWDKHVKQQAHNWRIAVTQWLNYNEFPVLIVGYENLKKDTYTELKKILDFIGYPYTEDDLVCAVKNSGESFHRKHTRKDLHPFSAELQKAVLNEIKQVDAGLLKHNISVYHPYSAD